jgi:hypothetical protein
MNDLAMPARARASSTRATAARRSRLLAIDSLMSACSTGSSKICHHGRSAMDSACAVCTNRYSAGVGIAGRE